MLYVDSRWQGNHGIARFSREVISRLNLPHLALSSRIPPAVPLDVIIPNRILLSKKDVVYSPGYNAGITRARQVLTVHDLIHLSDSTEASRLKTVYYASVVRPAIRQAGIVLTVSEASRLAISEWVQDSSVEVINVGNGCSKAFQHQIDNRSARPEDFVYVGNSKPHKNVDVILRALALRPHYRLKVIAPDGQRIARRARELGVLGQVSLSSGLQDEALAEIYRGSAALLMPSTLEGFGLPAMEAVMSGTRVVHWSGCSSVAEIVGTAGVSTSSASDAVEWAASMDAVGRLSQEGRVAPAGEWLDRYNWEHVAAAVESAIGRLV